MIEPLSITVATLSLISAVNTCLHAVKTILNAPGDIQDLIEELENSRYVVEDVKQLPWSLIDSNSLSLTRALKRVRASTERIDDFVKSRLLQNKDSHKVDRLAWQLHKSKLKELREQASVARMDLLGSLGTLTTRLTATILYVHGLHH